MNSPFLFDVFPTAVGPMTLVTDSSGAVTELWTSDRLSFFQPKPNYVRDPEAVKAARKQIEEYADGRRKSFDLTLNPAGTPFQHAVWNELLKIPYGETRSYGQLAAALGNPGASRAVGRANGTNPISVIVPCHRVIGSSGALTGYGGGLPMKQALLELEGAIRVSLFSTAK